MAMIVGIDEVGRGCWAGPLVAGAVSLHDPIVGLTDSKKLSKSQRQKLASQIQASATVGLGWVAANEVDELGLTDAVRLAMHRALAEISLPYDEIIIDGSYNFFPDNPLAKAITRADALVPAVSAASIVAKVARDSWMCEEAARVYPTYGFEKHVGYGTKLHQEMLRLHGICSLHRTSYKPVRAVITQSTRLR